jgi:hypothetical protein
MHPLVEQLRSPAVADSGSQSRGPRRWSDGNGCSFYLFETGEQIERGFYFFIVS